MNNTIDSFIAYETGCSWWATTAPDSVSRREHADVVRHQRGIRELAQHYAADDVWAELSEVTQRLNRGHEAVYGPNPPAGGQTLYIDLLRRYEVLFDLSGYLSLGITPAQPTLNVEPAAPTAPASQIEMHGSGIGAVTGKVW